MLRRWVGAGLLLGFACAVGLQVSAADKPKKGDAKPAEAVDSDKNPPGTSTGKLKTTPGTDGDFILSVEYQHVELKNPAQPAKGTNANTAYARHLQQLTRDQQHIAQLQQQMATARTQQQAASHMRSLQQAMQQYQMHLAQAQQTPGVGAAVGQNFVTKTDYKDVTFHLGEDVKVRIGKTPDTFDEKGNIKKYTKEELDELKGKDKTLVGYEYSLDKLQAGMQVKVTTVAVKPKPAAKKDDKDAPKKDDKDAPKKDDKDAPKKDDKDTPEHKTVVSLILVVDDTVAAAPNQPKKKK